jgi:hypothetical protein
VDHQVDLLERLVWCLFLDETSVGNGYFKLFRANINTEKDSTKTNIHASSSTVTDGCECAYFTSKPAYRFIYKYKKQNYLAEAML